jgi:hypothetical protein
MALRIVDHRCASLVGAKSASEVARLLAIVNDEF